MSRPALAIAASLSLFLAVSATQWLVTSPGEITYAERRLLLLAAIPALTTILSAYWVDAGRGDWR